MRNPQEDIMRSEKEIREEIRALKAHMRAKGIRRLSFMNGGHTMESMRANERMFALECELKRAKVGA